MYRLIGKITLRLPRDRVATGLSTGLWASSPLGLTALGEILWASVLLPLSRCNSLGYTADRRQVLSDHENCLNQSQTLRNTAVENEISRGKEPQNYSEDYSRLRALPGVRSLMCGLFSALVTT
jgi:hypothetical protein